MARQDQMEMDETVYDLVICGGGLAGLTLARQIKVKQPRWSVAILDPVERPLPEAGHKVGESSVELGAHYLAEKLQLTDYFEQHQLLKLGLRYFFGDSQGPITERPEMGLSAFPLVNSYQIDRGKLENDLRQFNVESGIVLFEGRKVQQVKLSEDELPHEVHITDRSGQSGRTLKARWVVDASGRRRLLQKQLGLGKEKAQASQHSASWFRLEGRIDIDDLVPGENKEWHERVPNKIRYFSTTHLMGNGYWVWLIPLSSNYTSIGIVASEALHPFSTFNTYERSMNWLETHEPRLAAHLKGREPLDFKVMRDYSYSAKQVFSPRRWACVGDAAAFVDPFYSPGNNMIGYANSMVIEMMRLDFAGELTTELVDEYNRFFLGLNDALTTNIQIAYPFYGQATVMASKLIWDSTNTWAFSCPQMFYDTYLDLLVAQQVRQITARSFSLIQAMQRLWVEWAALSPGRLTYVFLDYLKLEFLSDLRLRNLQSNKSLDQVMADLAENMQIVEEMAQAFFLLAVEDVLPEHWEKFKTIPWLNAWRVGLKPERWESDGLFCPATTPAASRGIYQELRRCFVVQEHTQARGHASS